MINPAMVSFMLKNKLDEILKGICPDGLIIKEKTEKKIILGLSNPEAYEGIALNSVNASITYKEVEIIITHGA